MHSLKTLLEVYLIRKYIIGCYYNTTIFQREHKRNKCTVRFNKATNLYNLVSNGPLTTDLNSVVNNGPLTTDLAFPEFPVELSLAGFGSGTRVGLGTQGRMFPITDVWNTVARCDIFKPKIPIWVNFNGLAMEGVGSF
jgi:hypothetical protein